MTKEKEVGMDVVVSERGAAGQGKTRTGLRCAATGDVRCTMISVAPTLQ